MKKIFTTFFCLLLIIWVFNEKFGRNVNALAVSSISITGDGITASSAPINTSITPTISWTTTTNLNQDSEFIRIKLNGTSVALGQTLSVSDLTFSGCSSNLLETFPGSLDNGIHEVTVINGLSGNDNPTIIINLDNAVGPVSPSCPAGNMNLSVDAGQLVSHDSSAGNFVINIVTSYDEGGVFFYVASENDVFVRAIYNSQIGFSFRNADDTADLSRVNGTGTFLCSLGRLNLITQSTCSYRIKISTNAVNGYFVSSSVDDDLNNSLDTEFISNTPTGFSPNAPNEGYNIALEAGDSTDGLVTECTGVSFGNCLGDGIAWNNNVGIIFNHTSNSVMFSSSGPNSPAPIDLLNTTLVTHRAIADQTTVTGNYDQLVVYTLTPVF